VPRRSSGICEDSAARASSVILSVIAVAMKPGATALHVMLREASSRAMDFVSPMRPAFYAA